MSQILGGQKFKENIFSDNIIKTIVKKSPSILKIYSLFFVFIFLCLYFCLSDYWGGKKRGFAPILIIGGRMPGLPPRVYAYGCRPT